MTQTHTPGPDPFKMADDLSGVKSADDLDAILAAPLSRTERAERDSLREVNAELLWLVQNQDRHTSINASRDASRSVASHDKEFIAAYDRRKRAAIAKAEAQ